MDWGFGSPTRGSIASLVDTKTFRPSGRVRCAAIGDTRTVQRRKLSVASSLSGWELIFEINGSLCTSQVCRNSEQLLTTSELWKIGDDRKRLGLIWTNVCSLPEALVSYRQICMLWANK